jgi:hypothetical protein
MTAAEKIELGLVDSFDSKKPVLTRLTVNLVVILLSIERKIGLDLLVCRLPAAATHFI